MAAHFQFIMRSGPNVGKAFPLEAQEISIGRDNSNTIVINDVEVSRRHAKMEFRGSAYVIQDLGSTNGTFVNGQRLSGIQVLNPGDTVAFGEGIMMTYEPIIIYDPSATSVASSGRAVKPATPARRPPVKPIPVSVPPPSYSGQVPAGPIPAAAEPARAKKAFPVWLIIVILLLLVICACAAFFIVIDQLSLWCRVVPFLVPMLGGTCG